MRQVTPDALVAALFATVDEIAVQAAQKIGLENGISTKRLQRARARAQVKAVKIGSAWYWQTPEGWAETHRPPVAKPKAIPTMFAAPAPKPASTQGILPDPFAEPPVERAAPPLPLPVPEQVNASPAAHKMAKRFNLPAALEQGEISMGKVAKCFECDHNTTPFRFGTHLMCPHCARIAADGTGVAYPTQVVA